MRGLHSGDGGGHRRGSPGRSPGWGVVLRESALLLRAHRGRLLSGLVLLGVGRAAALVPPASAGWLLDRVV
ncbi:MAG: hypothetical protein J0M02_08845, partial [Planctomycetes bacterium]|nr:hypothetical protein [Planctomycetota bacterium]